MTWDLGLRLWFLVATTSLATASWLAGPISALPRAWRAIDIAVIGLVGVLGAIGLNASVAALAGVALVASAMTESVGLWVGMGRRGSHAAGRLLVVGGTLCVLFACIRLLSAATRAATSTNAAPLEQLLIEGVLQPLLILLGAVALGAGCRLSSTRTGSFGIVASISYFVAVLLIAFGANEAVVGESLGKVLGLGSLAFAFAVPILLVLFRYSSDRPEAA